jgi:mRNA interferase MazF
VQGGCRPVLIVSNDVGNTYAETLNVLPMTRQLKKPNLPCHTELDPQAIADKHQMMDNSMILAEQITTISKDQLRNYVGRIEKRDLQDSIDHAVSIQLGLTPISLHNEERSACL